MTEQKKKINYTVACISEFAHRYHMTLKNACAFLVNYNVIQFMNEYYDIEHTLSFDDAVNDMVKICENNGGKI